MFYLTIYRTIDITRTSLAEFRNMFNLQHRASIDLDSKIRTTRKNTFIGIFLTFNVVVIKFWP